MSSIEAAARLNRQIQIVAAVARADAESAAVQRQLAHRTLDEVLDAAIAEVADGKKLGEEGTRVDTTEAALAIVRSAGEHQPKEIQHA